MEINFKYINRDILEDLYKKAEAALKRSLLNGDQWMEIKEKEMIFTELSIQMHRSTHPEDFGETPAESYSKNR
ncbi:MAG: hypothetical protein NVS1B13_14380 [Flavisolibacter sp.]